MTLRRLKLYASVVYDEWKGGIYTITTILIVAALSYGIGWWGDVEGHGNRIGIGFALIVIVCCVACALLWIIPACSNWWKTIQKKVDERDSHRPSIS